MASTVIYPLSGYPTVYLTTDGAEMTIRPMVPDDRGALLAFFRSLSPAERFVLKDDVTDAEVIAHWAQTLDYRRVVPLLAFLDGKLVGDGTLHHRRAGARKHVGEVRVVVHPDYRHRGVGRALLHKLVDLAGEKGLKQLLFEVVADTEQAARHTAQVLGFVPIATLPSQVSDLEGTLHDVIILERRLIPDLAANEEVEEAVPVF